MQVYKILLACALTICTRAQRNNPPIANFAAYGLPGCRENSQRNYTLRQTDDSTCYVFTPLFPTNIQSAYTTTIVHGCVMYVYTDANCRNNARILPQGAGSCFDEPSGLGSYKAICGQLFPTPIESPSASACHG